MALFSWNQKYSVGVQAVDSQHMGLFSILNELHAGMMSGQGKDLTGPMLKKLLEYTRTHFRDEERMMAKTLYPGLTEHKVLHQELVKQVDSYVARFERGEITLNAHLLNFLRDWLTSHIQKTDQQYSGWMKEHGVS